MRKTRYENVPVRGLFLCLIAFTLAPIPAHAFPARFGLSPDNSQSLLISTIKSATQSLLINMYQFDEAAITDAVVDRLRAGVAVSLLIEGEPLGSVSPEGRSTLLRLRDEMASARTAGASHLYVMSAAGNASSVRRYKYDHAKYMVIDSRAALVTSENFTGTGHPVAGQIGNRGWEAALESPELAAQLMQIFQTDVDKSHGDIVEVGPGDPIPQATQHGGGFNPFNGNGNDNSKAVNSGPRPVPALPGARGDVASVTLITSPDSLAGLLAMIHSAQHDVELEYMSLPSTWRDAGSGPALNPIANELIQAARRGVNVRVLLNDDAVFSPGATTTAKRPNEVTARLLLDYARCYQLALDARIVSVKGAGISYIHNKGMIVDGARALISSVNGTKNSVMNNREVAVQLESPDAARYFGQAFDFDWKVSPPLSVLETASCPGLN